MKAAESSIVVAFRALVMLACLVVAPLAAIFGSTFPEVVRAWLIKPLLGQTESETGADSAARPIGAGGFSSDPSHPSVATGPVSPAPFWQPPGMASPQSPSPGNVAAGAAGPAEAPTTPSAPTPLSPAPAAGIALAAAPPFGSSASQAGSTGTEGPDATRAAFSSPMDGPQSGGRAAAAQARFPEGHVDPLGRAQGPASAAGAYGPAGGSAYGAAPGAPAAVPPAGESQQFAWFEKRLREHGAAYYLLETWGADGELYRFHCKMAVAGNPNYTRHFEATDPDKLQAMAKVLAQVEAWRSGRLP